jgi:uncharacterized protein
MARPKAEFPSAAAIRARADSTGRLVLRVTPSARTESVELGDNCVQVKVRTKPEDGKANEKVMELLAKSLSIATSRLHLLRGASGRDKLIQLPD